MVCVDTKIINNLQSFIQLDKDKKLIYDNININNKSQK